MLDKLLEIGSMFDWITPLAAEIQDHAYGPPHTFFIPEGCGRSGYEIKHLLRRDGIQTWGHMIVNHAIMVTVPAAQARRAQDLLQRDRVPIEYGLLDEAGSTAGRSGDGLTRSSSPGLLGRLADEVADWLGL